MHHRRRQSLVQVLQKKLNQLPLCVDGVVLEYDEDR
jgi:hypothetical protein